MSRRFLILVGVAWVSSLAPVAAVDLLYDFEGDSGTTVTDKLDDDGAQNGTILNNVAFETAAVPFGDQAARFSAPTAPQLYSTIEIPGSTELGSAFTLAANVNYTNSGFTRLFTSYRGSGGVGADRMILDMDPSGSTIPGLRLIVNNTVAATLEPPAGLSEAGYHHVAATYDDGAVAIYLDGVPVELSADVLGSGPVSMTANLRFGEDPHDGGGSANEQFRGNVDELLVLGRALSSDDIAALAAEGVAASVTPAEGELAIYYDFEPPDAGQQIGDRFGANDGIAHNNVAVDADAANAAFGVQSAVLGDKIPEELYSTIEIPGSSDLGPSFTIAADVNYTNTGFTRLFTSFRGTGPVGTDRMILDMDPSGSTIPGLRLIVNNMVAVTVSTVVPLTLAEPGYHHIAATYDDGAVAIYLDGTAVPLDQEALGSGPINMTANLRFGEDPHDGGGSANEQFRGNVDELLVLGRALTPSEVAAVAESGVAANVTPAEGELAIYYDFEPPDGGTAIGDRFGANDGITHNNAMVDGDSANARRGVQSAVLGDKPPPVPFTAIDVGQVGSLGNAFTMAAMINVPGGGHASGGLARLFSTYAGSGSAAGRLIFDFDPNASVSNIGIRFLLPDGAVVIHEGTFSVDENHHLAATYDRGDITVYLDGTPVAATSTPGGDIDLGEFPLRIGEDLSGAVNENFVGVMDEALILSRALGPDEIELLATLGFGAEPPQTPTVRAGDCNVDGTLDVGDLSCYTKSLFPAFSLLDRGPPPAPPCEGDLGSEGNLALLDLTGDDRVDAVDAVTLASFLFGLGGPPPQGTECLVIGEELGCGDNPGCQ